MELVIGSYSYDITYDIHTHACINTHTQTHAHTHTDIHEIYTATTSLKLLLKVPAKFIVSLGHFKHSP